MNAPAGNPCPAPAVFPVRMLLATGVPYLMMMGSTFSSLGVVLPHMIAPLHMNWGQAGSGFTLLGLAAGLSSLLPTPLIRRWGARVTMSLGALTLAAAYAVLATCRGIAGYEAGALLLGVGFSLIGAVPGLTVLSGWAGQRQGMVFGCYLACGGLGGAVWPSLVEAVISATGGWRGYWWFMVSLMAGVGGACVALVGERPAVAHIPTDPVAASHGWTLFEALRSGQFYLVGLAIAATYLIASTVNAFTFSYLSLIGVATSMAVVTFSIQSACHAAFPLLMGGVAERVGAERLLIGGLVIQAVGMLALAFGSSRLTLLVFAVGVGGGYGTVFLATTLVLERYFGARHYCAVFGANQLFTTISVIGPVVVGVIADRTGRFDESFAAGAGLLLMAAGAAALLRPPPHRIAASAVAR